MSRIGMLKSGHKRVIPTIRLIKITPNKQHAAKASCVCNINKTSWGDSKFVQDVLIAKIKRTNPPPFTTIEMTWAKK